MSGQGQDLGRLLYQIVEGLLIRKPVGASRRHSVPSSRQIAVMPSLLTGQ
jgi:hypothetical protein